MEQTERALTTVVVGLEILTGICAGIEDSELEAAEEEVEDVEGDEDEAMEEGDDLADDALIEMAREPDAMVEASSAPTVATAVTLSHLLSTLNLPRRLTSLATLNTLSFPPSTSDPSPHPPTTSILSVLHLRALETLNNLLLTVVASLPSEAGARSQAAGVVPSAGVWSSMFAVVDPLLAERGVLAQKGQELRTEVLEMALGCAWGCAKIDAEGLVSSAPGLENIR